MDQMDPFDYELRHLKRVRASRQRDDHRRRTLLLAERAIVALAIAIVLAAAFGVFH
jgi:hypothetical protein